MTHVEYRWATGQTAGRQEEAMSEAVVRDEVAEALLVATTTKHERASGQQEQHHLPDKLRHEFGWKEWRARVG